MQALMFHLAFGVIKNKKKGQMGERGKSCLWSLFLCNEEWPQPSAACLLSPGQGVKEQAEISMQSPSHDLMLALAGGVARNSCQP